MRLFFPVALGQSLALLALAILGILGGPGAATEPGPPFGGAMPMGLPIDEGITTSLLTAIPTEGMTYADEETEQIPEPLNKRPSKKGIALQADSKWERAVGAADRHKALLLAMLLGGALLGRIFHLAYTGRGLEGVQRARNELAYRTQKAEKDKKEAGVLTKTLGMIERQAARAEGIAERRRHDLEEQGKALQAEREALKMKELEVAKRREAVEELETKSQEAMAAASQDEDKTPGKQKQQATTVGDTVARVEAELAVFDVAATTFLRERERGALLTEYNELIKIHAATAVLDALPSQSLTPQEAKDTLRARRMLLGAVVRFQTTIWSSIARLLEKKGELLAEKILVESEKIGEDELGELAEREWDVKQAEQARCTKTVDQLGGKLDVCLQKQTDLHAYMAAHEKTLSEEEAKEIATQLFKWESYEVTLRARRAQILYTNGSAPMTRDTFIKQRLDRVQKAKDNEAERGRRLPDAALRAAELESAISAISEELQELRDFYKMANEVRDAYEAPDPESQTDDEEEGAEEVELSSLEARRRTRFQRMVEDEYETPENGNEE